MLSSPVVALLGRESGQRAVVMQGDADVAETLW
jgi:hypothetical protein